MQNSPLINREYELLNWDNFSYPNMVRIKTIGDGSCFFHAIAKSYFIPYKLGILDGEPLDKLDFVRKLRRDLAMELAKPINAKGQRHYDIISRGKLPESAKKEDGEFYTLSYMQEELGSNRPIDNRYNEF